ncbi:MAG: hypothetical protein U0T69_00230 [Chitinophagales bacterium]
MSDAQKQGGFVRIEYNEEEIKRIIDNNEIVIALDDNNVIAYYLVGKKSESKSLLYQYNKAVDIAKQNNIPIEKIGYGCQVCIDENYRNNRLFSQMLGSITTIINEKYSHLLCSISNENSSSYKSHINNNWHIVDSIEKTQFLIYTIDK